MIIKSYSRKEPTFSQLINYINKWANEISLKLNLFWNTQKEIEKEFKINSSYLNKSKWKNFLYHEIISLSPNNKDKIKPQELEKILIDIWNQYLQKRAWNSLSYAKIHTNKKHIHLHICISANEREQGKRLRLEKSQFRQIKKDLESYVLNKYPQLKEPILFNKAQEQEQEQTEEKNKNLALSKNEQELKKRTKEPTKKEAVRELLIQIFDNSNSKTHLLQNLKMNWLEIYQRGKTISVLNTQDKRKYRLKTLNLEKELKECKDKFNQRETNLKDIWEFRQELESREAEHQKENQDLESLNKNSMNSKEAKQIPIKELLNKLWYSPSYQKGVEFWYISPFREEKSPSFKIDEVKNLWFDFWEGRGWNILDFMMTHQNQDFKTALREISQLMSEYSSLKTKWQPSLFNQSEPTKKASIYHQEQTQKTQDKKAEPSNSQIKIKKIQDIQNLALIDYLEKRAVNPNIAKLHLKEIYYSLWEKHYFSLAFKNNSDWYELRNPYFKGVTGSKDLTIIKNNSKELLIFEGFLDFLSFISLYPNSRPRDFIILNSVSLTAKAINHIKEQQNQEQGNNQSYSKIECFLDNDQTGKKAFNLIKENLENSKEQNLSNQTNLKIIDKSYIYKNHKDFNEFIQAHRDKKLKELQRLQNLREPLERVREKEENHF